MTTTQITKNTAIAPTTIKVFNALLIYTETCAIALMGNTEESPTNNKTEPKKTTSIYPTSTYLS